MTMTILRVECKRGEGPYRGIGVGYANDVGYMDGFCTNRHNNDDHPSYGDDIILQRGVRRSGLDISDFHFAFKDKRQLLDWFNLNDRIAMRKKSFYISVYSAPAEDVVVSDRQVLFRKETAKLISKRRI